MAEAASSSSQPNAYQSILDEFGEIPKHLPEDVVGYSLYILTSPDSASTDIRSQLRNIDKEGKRLVDTLLAGYIWQRDPFSWQIEWDTSLPYLHGKVCYGDSIADEWTIVYLLLQISAKFPDAWIKVHGSDGEFLLIEAAASLPKWLTPEVADNRVWINRGRLLLIPISSQADKASWKNEKPSLPEALDFIALAPKKLLHLEKVQEDAFFRLRNYPGELESVHHHAHIRIPRKLAVIIHQCPASISPAIEAFYLRDPIALKSLRETTADTLKFSPKDLVTVSVKFTRVGFAYLCSQEFSAPKNWLPVFADETAVDETLKDKQVLGMKLSCGYEMVLNASQYQNNRLVRELKVILDDIESGEVEIPSDEVMQAWSCRQDDEDWMNINYEEFENELSGKRKQGSMPEGIGDEPTREALQRMMERFEAFLAEDDDDDDDDDEADSSDASSTTEELVGEYGTQEPGTGADRQSARHRHETYNSNQQKKARWPHEKTGITPLDEEDESDNSDQFEGTEEDFSSMARQMEAELAEAGFLDGHSVLQPRSSYSHERGSAGGTTRHKKGKTDAEDVAVEHLMESLKSDSGATGPLRNMMRMMGIDVREDEEAAQGRVIEEL